MSILVGREHIFVRKVRQVGGSDVVTIPRQILRYHPRVVSVRFEYNDLFGDVVVTFMDADGREC
jgi:hypothetical protein